MPVKKSIVIMVERIQEEEEEMLSDAVPKALREYTKAVEEGRFYIGGHEKFGASNGCVISAMALSDEIEEPKKGNDSWNEEIIRLKNRIEKLERTQTVQLKVSNNESTDK